MTRKAGRAVTVACKKKTDLYFHFFFNTGWFLTRIHALTRIHVSTHFLIRLSVFSPSQSMSGKSRLLINMAAQWFPYFVSQPISEIIYVGNNWPPEYEKRLKAVGEALGIKVFMVRGGLQNETFQRCWEEKRRSIHGHESDKNLATISQKADDRQRESNDDNDDLR